jgi:hypothetical protein
MRWEEWKFSARLGLQDQWLRVTFLLAIVIVLGMSGFMFWRILPDALHTGVVTMHYNVYLGIDDVRPWPWIFTIPGAALGLLLIDGLMGLGLFRKHPLAARTLTTIGLSAALVWGIGTFFLTLVNI